MKLVLLVLVVLIAGCQSEENIQDFSLQEQQTSEQTFSQIETGLLMAQKTGGVHPDTYKMVNQQISELEESGFTPERIKYLRGMLSKLEVGGEKVDALAKGQFIELENEIMKYKNSGFFIDDAYGDRLRIRLEEVRANGYDSGEIERLLVIISELKPARTGNDWVPPSTCSGSKVELTASSVSLSDIDHIVPMGQMSGPHVTPTDHGYIITNDAAALVDLVSPADGYILTIGAFENPNDFRMVLWHSCTIATIYIHVKEIAPEILSVTGNIFPGKNWGGDQGPPVTRILPIPVKAGQVIGKIRGGVDFSVHDTSVNLTGFVTPSLYDGEPWKIHTVDMFGYFTEPLQSELKKKSLRSVAPVGGKIDYDIDGRLVGNWFIEGTDYSGKGESCTYYECHLAFAYDNIKPEMVRISLPNAGVRHEDCKACLGAYPVKSNAPDPSTVSVATGLVKYEFISFERDGSDTDKILGTFLVQMTSDRKIKTEFFLGKTKSEVSGFTSSAKVYHRDAVVFEKN